MRGGAIILAIAMLSLTACEKDFDEKYQDSLEKLNEEAKEIKSGVEQQLAEGREADKTIELAEDSEKQPEIKGDAAE